MVESPSCAAPQCEGVNTTPSNAAAAGAAYSGCACVVPGFVGHGAERRAPQEALQMLRGLRIAMHPDDGQPITLETGKYGPYIKHGTTYAALPKVGHSHDQVSMPA